MTLVADASLVVAWLLGDDHGPWAEELIGSDDLAAPHLMPVEVAHVLRSDSLAGRLAPEIASLAHYYLSRLSVSLFPYAPVARRVWELRSNVSTYDGWYVALAEMLDTPLATVDRRLARATGPRCEFLTPPPALRSE